MKEDTKTQPMVKFMEYEENGSRLGTGPYHYIHDAYKMYLVSCEQLRHSGSARVHATGSRLTLGSC